MLLLSPWWSCPPRGRWARFGPVQFVSHPVGFSCLVLIHTQTEQQDVPAAQCYSGAQAGRTGMWETAASFIYKQGISEKALGFGCWQPPILIRSCSLWGRWLEPLPPAGSAPLRQNGAVGLDLQLRKSHDGWRGRQQPSRGRIWPWPPYCDAVEMCTLCVKALSSSHQCHTSSPPQPDVVWSVHETRDLPEALPKPPAEGKPYRKPSHLPTDVPKDISWAPTLLQEYLHWKPEFLKIPI